jgi:hypothetical protein
MFSVAPASSSMFSPTSVLIAIVIILLIALLGSYCDTFFVPPRHFSAHFFFSKKLIVCRVITAMAALLFSKIRKLRADDNPYGALQEGSSTAVSLNA